MIKLTSTGEDAQGAPYSGGGVNGTGFGITLDPNGNVWVGNFGFKSIKNKTRKRFKPLAVQTSTVKKSAATISSQCRVRNSFQVVFLLRSGAGSIPFRSR